MKKTTCFLAFLLCCVLLAGCTTASDVSLLIDNIGTVTLRSGEDIEAAQASYDSLFALSKGSVDNYNTLVSARTVYDNMVAADAQMTAAIEAIGEITLDSGAALTKLREDYDENCKRYSPESFVPVLLQLEEMEKQYQECVWASQYQKAEELYAQKKYEDAITALEYLKRNAYGYVDRCNTLIEKIGTAIALDVQAEAKVLLNAGDPLGALEKMNTVDSEYRFEGDYFDLRDAALAQLESRRPKNGSVLQKTLGSGSNTFKVETKEGDDYCVKLESVSNPDKYILFYVRGGKSATVNVPDGTYTIKYATGEYWCDLENYFYPFSSFHEGDDTTSFESDAFSYTQVIITLYQVTNGNFSSSYIDEDAF